MQTHGHTRSVYEEPWRFLSSTFHHLNGTSDYPQPEGCVTSKCISGNNTVTVDPENDGVKSGKMNMMHLLFIIGVVITSLTVLLEKIPARYLHASTRRSKWSKHVITTLIRCLQGVVPMIWTGALVVWIYDQGVYKFLQTYLVGFLVLKAWSVFIQVNRWLILKAIHRRHGPGIYIEENLSGRSLYIVGEVQG